MGSGSDFNRGHQAGYSGMVKAPARNAAEAMGRSSGQNQREWEYQQGRKGSGGYDSALISPKLLVLVLVGLVPVGIALASHRSVGWALVFTITLLALGLSWRVRRLLGMVAPVLIGGLLGLVLGALRLFVTDGVFSMENVLIYPLLGGIFGVLLMLVLKRRTR